MKFLLRVANGSRRAVPNAQIAALTQRPDDKSGYNVGATDHASLGLVETRNPDGIPEGIPGGMHVGALSFSVVPDFLARDILRVGYVREQVVIKQKAHRYKDVHIIGLIKPAN